MFLTDDYDRLSPLGNQQAERVGSALATDGPEPTHVFVGSLKRQQQTLAGIRISAGQDVVVNEALLLNEFPFDAMLRVQIDRFRGRNELVDTSLNALEGDIERDQRIRHVQRLLEFAIDDWVRGDRRDEAAGIPSWQRFLSGVYEFIETIQQRVPSRSHVVAVTSGGVVAAATQYVLDAPPLAAARLCWRVNNASLTQMTFTQSRLSLDHFNRIGHIPASLRTYR